MVGGCNIVQNQFIEKWVIYIYDGSEVDRIRNSQYTLVTLNN